MYHTYITISMFSSQQTGELICIGILTQTYICEHIHFISYMKVSTEKLFVLRIIEFSLLWIFIIVIKFTIIGVDIADGRQLLTANSRRIIADDCFHGVNSWPAAGDIYAHTTPNWIKLLPSYERDIGQAAASPLSAMNGYKSSAPRLQFLLGVMVEVILYAFDINSTVKNIIELLI